MYIHTFYLYVYTSWPVLANLLSVYNTRPMRFSRSSLQLINLPLGQSCCFGRATVVVFDVEVDAVKVCVGSRCGRWYRAYSQRRLCIFNTRETNIIIVRAGLGNVWLEVVLQPIICEFVIWCQAIHSTLYGHFCHTCHICVTNMNNLLLYTED